MKDLITIGLPSKGRLKEKSISFFNDRGLKIIQSEKERNYFGTIENKPNVKIIFLHAKEIIQRLGDGTLDNGVIKAGFVFKLGELNKPTQISMKDKKVMETKIETLEEKNKQLLARLERLEKIALGESNSPDLAVYQLK